MLDKILTHYKRNDGLETDRNEKIGNYCLHFLRTACGKSYEVTTQFTLEAQSSRLKRITNLFLAVVTFPIILIGGVATILSKTHGVQPLKKDDKVGDVAKGAISPKNSPESPNNEASPLNPSKNSKPIESCEACKSPCEACKTPIIDSVEKLKSYYLKNKEQTQILKLANLDLSQEFNDIIKQMPHLVTFEAVNCKMPGNIYNLRHLNKLENLTLSNCNLEEYHIAHIVPVIGRVTNLNLSHNNVGDFVAGLVRNINGSRLATLNLDSTHLHNPKNLIDKHYNTHRKIDTLSIKDNAISAEQVLNCDFGNVETIYFSSKTIPTSLEKKILKKINLDQWIRENGANPINTERPSPTPFIEEAANAKSTALHLKTCTPLTDSDCEKICQMESLDLLIIESTVITIQQFEKIIKEGQFRRLHLIGIRPGEKGLNKLTQSKESIRLTEIKFERGGINDEKFMSICTSPYLSNLKSLSIIDDELTDKAVKAPLKNNLKEFDFSHNLITKYGVLQFANISDSKPNLTTINLTGNEIDVEYMTQMKSIEGKELSKKIKY